MTTFQLLLIAVAIFLIWLFNSVNILREYERGVVFRLGRLLPNAKGPGLIFVFFPIDRLIRVGLRTITMDVPTQDVITADNVTVKVNAVVYFRVVDAPRAMNSAASRQVLMPPMPEIGTLQPSSPATCDSRCSAIGLTAGPQ